MSEIRVTKIGVPKPSPKVKSPRPPRVRARIKPKPRSRSEYARIYGSKARVEWVKQQPCLYCDALSHFFGAATAGKCHNAHTVSGGKGRKADFDTIIPLCASHHRAYDDYEKPFDREVVRDFCKQAAAKIEERWKLFQSHIANKKERKSA